MKRNARIPREDRLPQEDRTQPADESSAESAQPAAPVTEETLLKATVTAEKALLREIKGQNKAGRPILRIHEPRVRFETGETLQVLPDELLADGGVIYLSCVEHPGLYVRIDDISLSPE